jgi:uncharacterized protein involved in exopolysaccharide biosynthesis
MTDAILRDLFNSFDIMWKWMLGLFVVCGAIALLTAIITKLVKGKR